MDHGELLAGLVRNHSIAGRLHYGCGGCLVHCCPFGSLGRDLCERSGAAKREEPD